MFLFDSDIIIIDALFCLELFPSLYDWGHRVTVREVLPADGPDVITIMHQVFFLVIFLLLILGDRDCQKEHFTDAIGRDLAY